jgi:hypothetical protein
VANATISEMNKLGYAMFSIESTLLSTKIIKYKNGKKLPVIFYDNVRVRKEYRIAMDASSASYCPHKRESKRR